MKRVLISTLALLALSCGRETAVGDRSDEKGTKRPAQAESAESRNPEMLEAGSPLPSLKLKDLSGNETDLAELKDKVTLVNIWATWCGPCRVEIPDLIAIHREMAPQGVQVVGVSVDAEGALEDVKAFAREQQINYPMLLDPNGELAARFDASVIPLSLLVDKKGKVVWVHYGVIERDSEIFKEKVAAALAS